MAAFTLDTEAGVLSVDAWIYDADVNGPDGKASPHARIHEPRAIDVLRRNVVRDVHDRGLRRRAEDHAFHLRDVSVDRAEIREQRYDASHVCFAVIAPPCGAAHRRSEFRRLRLDSFAPPPTRAPERCHRNGTSGLRQGDYPPHAAAS